MGSLRDIGEEEKKSHLRNLISLAAKDEKIDSAEHAVMGYVTSKWGMTQAEVAEVFATMNDIKFIKPETEDACFHQLFDLTELMIIDGVIKKDERDLCESLAYLLGYQPEAVDAVIQSIIESNQRHRTEDAKVADARRKADALKRDDI